MGVDLSGFEAAVGAFVGKDLPAEVLDLSQEIATVIGKGVVELTPERTSNLVASWKAGVGRKPRGYSSRRVDPGGAATLARLLDVIRSAKPYQIIYIRNLAPHAHLVEDGSVHNRPRKMLERAVDRAAARMGAR